jgi:ABC-type cobalamin/Fe3+-siderophores transport system ATPase subunit
MYYIESENKSGKTSLLRMFSMNLMAGEIAFDTLNRKNVSFENLRENIFHIVQSSEDNDKFTRKELEYLSGKDLWLEKHLKLENILHKGTEELNGGSKKRLYLYMALISKCQILLLDEVLAELDVNEDETEGALIDTLKALTEWPGRKEKVILLIGHGLKKLIKNSESVQKLGIVQNEDETILVEN